MQKKKKVFVGLSGGVDSAVSAALLKKEGHDVTGVFIKIAIPGYPCPAAEDRREALRVAAHLQIPFHEIDLSKEYEKKILSYTIESYRRGETPNPDTLCNREIKFGLLYDWCMQNGAEYIATGHYARVEKTGSRTHLRAGRDPEKDQSYFLWMVPEERLARTLFPVGGLYKSEVRALAKKFGLPNAERKDSQGLCFLGALSLDELLQKELAPAPGDVLDEHGKKIGAHDGAVLYTIGQRRGFSIHAETAHEKPHYIVAKDAERNTLTVSENPRPEEFSGTRITLREENWIGEIASGGCAVRFRYRQPLISAVLSEDAHEVQLNEAYAVPVGQSLVLYQNERCLGGGVIERVY